MNERKVKPLNNENFKPYGKLIEKPSSNPEADEDTHKWWGKVGVISAEGIISTGIMEVKHRDFTVPKLEEHVKTAEMLIPLKGNSVLVVGKKSSHGTLKRIVAFYFNNDQVIIMEQGILHWVPFPLGEKAVFAVIFRSKTPEDDLSFEKLEENIRLKL